jgi:hypothetical protein
MPSKKAENFNWYEKIPKKYLNKSHNPHFDVHHISIPFRGLIIGNSGSMKTNTLLNLIFNMPETFERIVICLKSKDEPLYNYLGDKLKDNGVEIVEGLDNLPDVDSFDKTVQSLVVLDDLVLEKNQKQIEEFYIRARKRGCSLLYISQSYFLTPKTIRNNLTHIFIKQVSSLKNLTRIMNEYALGIDKKVFRDMYDLATHNKPDFLLVDLEASNPKMKFRKNFDQVLEFPEEGI